MAQKTKPKPAPTKREVAPPKVVPKTAEEIKEATKAMLDEIDEVLEENAEEFVRNYVQKGGQ